MTPLKKNLKIVGLYFLSLVLLLLFWIMENSNSLNDFLEKADNHRTDYGFGFFFVLGLLKYAFLLGGIAIPLLLSSLIFIRVWKKTHRLDKDHFRGKY